MLFSRKFDAVIDWFYYGFRTSDPHRDHLLTLRPTILKSGRMRLTTVRGSFFELVFGSLFSRELNNCDRVNCKFEFLIPKVW